MAKNSTDVTNTPVADDRGFVWISSLVVYEFVSLVSHNREEKPQGINADAPGIVIHKENSGLASWAILYQERYRTTCLRSSSRTTPARVFYDDIYIYIFFFHDPWTRIVKSTTALCGHWAKAMRKNKVRETKKNKT